MTPEKNRVGPAFPGYLDYNLPSGLRYLSVVVIAGGHLFPVQERPRLVYPRPAGLVPPERDPERRENLSCPAPCQTACGLTADAGRRRTPGSVADHIDHVDVVVDNERAHVPTSACRRSASIS